MPAATTTAPALTLTPVEQDHIPTLARICHEAFSALHDRHNIPRDVPDVETGTIIVGMTATRPDYTGVVAKLNDQIVGSNFYTFADEIAGVGPITVDPACQSKRIGRALMQWAVDEAKSRNIAQTRLFQEAINTTSLSLYTALGFECRFAAALMQAKPADSDHPRVRPITADDVDAIARISAGSYGHSRANDAAILIAAGIPGFIMNNDAGEPIAYLIPTLFGHAGTDPAHFNRDQAGQALLDLASHAARHIPEPLAKYICPLTCENLFRQALASGHRTLKVLTCMSLGDWTRAPGVHFPSIQC